MILLLAAASASARPLPFMVSLSSSSVPGAPVLALDQVADAARTRWAVLSREEKTLGALQAFFEEAFLREARRCMGEEQWQSSGWRVDQALRKWVGTYALEASVSSQDLQALREELRSAAFVHHLAQKHAPIAQARADADFESDSQWCGSFGKGCSGGELAKFITASSAPSADLDELLISEVSSLIESGRRDPQMHLLNYEILWDPPVTRVRYGVTFYVKESEDDGRRTLSYLGCSLAYLHEATPAPFFAQEDSTSTKVARSTETVTVKEVFTFLNIAASYPIGVAVGLKNASFELAKMPFSFIAGFLGRGRPYEYPYRNLKSAYAALKTEVLHPQKLGLLSGIFRLMGELPIVGPVFQHNDNPNRLDLDAPKRIFLTRGIYGGNALEQDTALWEAATRHFYPEAYIQAVPYEFGTVTDVIWSMFNLSHGQAYVMADRIMEASERGDRLYLVGHSAGVQRITYASRLLGQRGYDVRQMMGIAGPSLGQANVNTLYPTPFKLLLNPGGDIVSAIGLGAKGTAALVELGTLQPLRLIGGIALRWDRQRQERLYRFMNRMGPSNAQEEVVLGGVPAKHETPLRLSLTNSVVYDRFIRQEYANIFRDDLEYLK
ncbi:MAG: hypothetical protein WCU88_07965 [Elusimicrobiota bacterium]